MGNQLPKHILHVSLVTSSSINKKSSQLPISPQPSTKKINKLTNSLSHSCAAPPSPSVNSFLESQKYDIQIPEKTEKEPPLRTHSMFSFFNKRRKKISPDNTYYVNRYYSFYIKNISCDDIELIDYLNLDRTWKYVLNNELHLFKILKSNNEIENTDCLSWFYDTFYKNLYNFTPQIGNLFHNNLKIQSKALINIIQRCILFAKQASTNKKIDFYEIYVSHKKLNITINNYFELCYILLETLYECFGILFNKYEYSWRKILSLVISNMIIEENKASTIKSLINY